MTHHTQGGIEKPEQLARDAVGVRGREVHDDRGRGDVLDRLGEPGDESAPRAHRGAGERVGAARVRHRRGHLPDREDQAVVHHDEDREGDEHAAEAGEVDAEVPAREVARDDGGHREAPEAPDSRRALQPAFLEVSVVGGRVRHARDLQCVLRHSGAPLLSSRGPGQGRARGVRCVGPDYRGPNGRSYRPFSRDIRRVTPADAAALRLSKVALGCDVMVATADHSSTRGGATDVGTDRIPLARPAPQRGRRRPRRHRHRRVHRHAGAPRRQARLGAAVPRGRRRITAPRRATTSSPSTSR